MLKIISVIILICLTACQTLPTNQEQWMARERNACLPTAIAFKQGLVRQGVTSEVVIYKYKNTKNKVVGHAIVAYMYPPGKNQLWTYDYEGSWRTRAFISNPTQIAQQSERIRGRWQSVIEHAEFIK